MSKLLNLKRGFIKKTITILIALFIVAFILNYFDIDIRTIVEKSKLKEAIIAIWNFLAYLWIEYIWWFIKYIIDIFVEIFNKMKAGAN